MTYTTGVGYGESYGASPTMYEQQLALDLAAHDNQQQQLLAWDNLWEERTIKDGRAGLATGHDITEVLEQYNGHVAGMLQAVGHHLQTAQDYFAGMFAQSPEDGLRWRAARLFLERQPFTAELPLRAGRIEPDCSRRALLAALDMDVWRRLQHDRAVYAADDPRSSSALLFASTPLSAQLMARTDAVARRHGVLQAIDRFSFSHFVAGELYAGASPKTQAVVAFLLRMHTARRRSGLK